MFAGMELEGVEELAVEASRGWNHHRAEHQDAHQRRQRSHEVASVEMAPELIVELDH
eukprot:SAG31_NODE_477_length_15150_cov_13.611772_8_plen_57_part_00